jgi:hypothetical protein
MRWKSHVRFGERVGETDQPRGWHRAPARLHSRVRLPVMVVALVIVLLLMLLASFLANDAAASFDERRLPPAAKRGQVPERAALGPSKKTLL